MRKTAASITFSLLLASTSLAEETLLRSAWLTFDDIFGEAATTDEADTTTPAAKPDKMPPFITPAATEDTMSADDVLWNDESTEFPTTKPVEADPMLRALSEHNWPLALQLGQERAGAGVDDGQGALGIYTQAIALGMQGQYDQALAKTSALRNAPSVYANAGKAWEATLQLHQAELAVLQNNLEAARAFLTAYEPVESQAGRANQQRATRLKTMLEGTPSLQEPLRIGVILPLSGPHAKVGEGVLNAMQMAVFAAAGQAISLHPVDSGTTPDSAATAAQTLLESRVDAVVGPLLSPQVDAVKVAFSAHTPVLALSSDPHAASPNVHVFSYRPDQQAQLAAHYAVQHGRRTFAAMVPANPYGYDIYEAFRAAAVAQGATVLAAQFYNPEKADLSEYLEDLLNLSSARRNQKQELAELEQEQRELGRTMEPRRLQRLKYLKDARPEAVVNFDALFVPTDAKNLSLVTSQLALYDMDKLDVMFLGTAAWGAPQLAKGDPYIRQSRFAAPPTGDFTTRYTATYGNGNPHPLAVLGEGAVHVLLAAAQQADSANQSLAQALLRPEGFAASGGAIRFTANGLPERAYQQDNLTPSGVVHVEQAPVLLPPALPYPLDPAKKSYFE
ncbi:MAG: penicillin-binding protein activator [Alphaproteobacteria bacterium]